MKKVFVIAFVAMLAVSACKSSKESSVKVDSVSVTDTTAVKDTVK